MHHAPLPPPAEPLDSVALLQRSRRDADGLAQALVSAARSRLEGPAQRRALDSDRAQILPVLAVLQAQARPFSRALADQIERQMAGDSPAQRPAAARSGALTLVSEDSIDEDIEVARVVQAVDADADWHLGRLAALTSSLAGRDTISVDSIPLRPAVIAKAIRVACLGFDLDKPARLRLMREIGAGASGPLVAIYQAQADWLEASGVKPTDYRIRKPPGGHTAALGRLVGQARAGRERMPTTAELASPGEPFALRLLDEPVPIGEHGSLDAQTAVQVMERLIALLSHEVITASAPMQQVIGKLQGPARQIAARDPALWQSLDHPWWQLIDRVLAAASVDAGDGSESTAVSTTLESAIEALVLAGDTDASACTDAVNSIDFAITGLLDDGRQAIDRQISQLGLDDDLDSLEHDYRDQIVLQLRTVAAPLGLRQFLLGPWPMVLAATARRYGRGSRALNRQAQFVDLLIEHCAHHALTPPASELIDPLLLRASRGMRKAGLPHTRIQSELRDLRQLLTSPGPPAASDPLEQVPAIPVPQVMELQDGLPTVPIDMDDSENGPGARDRHLWLDSLEVGNYCLLYIGAHWATAQLTWCDDSRTRFVFASRHAGRLHSLSRRALEKLRAAGLATTLQRGQLLAQAMDTLADEFLAPPAQRMR